MVHPASCLGLFRPRHVEAGLGSAREHGHDPWVRVLDDDEADELVRMGRSRNLGAGLVRRAQIVRHAVEEGLSAPEIAARMDLCDATVRFWLKRFNERGLQGLEE